MLLKMINKSIMFFLVLVSINFAQSMKKPIRNNIRKTTSTDSIVEAKASALSSQKSDSNSITQLKLNPVDSNKSPNFDKTNQPNAFNKFKDLPKILNSTDSSAKTATFPNGLDKLINQIRNRKNPESDSKLQSNSTSKLQKAMERKQPQPSMAKLLDYSRMKNNFGEKVIVKWDKNNGTPSFISFSEAATPKPDKPEITLSAQQSFAIAFAGEYKNMFGLENPEKELILEKSETDDIGFTHLRYQQYYKGLKVWAQDIYFHFNKSGALQSINGQYQSTPEEIEDTNFSISEMRALEIVSDDLNLELSSLQEKEAGKIIFVDEGIQPRLAWFVEIIPSLLHDWYYFVDGKTGEILKKYDNHQQDGPVQGSGVDLQGDTQNLDLYQVGSKYYMINTTKKMYDIQNSVIPNNPVGAIVIGNVNHDTLHSNVQLYLETSTSRNQWANNSVSLAYHFSVTYDYYQSVHGRKSLDDAGHNILGVVNLGQEYVNAFWHPGVQALFFGNGDGRTALDFTVALDIVAHEFGHGVTQFTSNLEYLSQSGALNEAFSDFSGAMVEFYENPNTANWLCGEDCTPAGSDYIASRDMSNPHNPRVKANYSPAKMSEYYDLPETNEGDWGGVHVNCTIPAHVIYLISERIGRTKMEKIIYRTFTSYLNRQSQFIDFRVNTIQVARDLYPGTGIDAQIAAAFDEVEITDGSATEPDDPYEPVSGPDYVLMVYAENSQLLTVKSTVPLDQSSVSFFDAYASNKPSITEDGTVAVFIGQDKNIYLIDMTQNSIYQTTENGIWHSIAVSPKGDYLAVIPDPQIYPSTIYLCDVTTESWETRGLYIPTTGANYHTSANYADILDWSNDGGILIYDCYYQLYQQGSAPIGCWGIYMMQVENETIVSVFQPMENIDVGNPVFSSTRDNVIAFDLIDYRENRYNPQYHVMTFDLFSGELGTIMSNPQIYGSPSFSPTDKKVVFQDQNPDGSFFLTQIDLAEDGLNGVPSSLVPWINPVKMPVWYASGSRPSKETILFSENFDEEFPAYDWVISTTVPGCTWKQSNVKDYSFSEIDPENEYSAVCPYSPDTEQNEVLFSCDFSLAQGTATLEFYVGYNAYWLTHFDLQLFIADNENLQDLLWEALNDGQSGWTWRKVTLDLSRYSGMNDLYLAWQYVGKDGDVIAIDGVQLMGAKSQVARVAMNERLPFKPVLYRNFPNPFNPSTTFSFELPQNEFVDLSVFNISGQLVEQLIYQEMTSGKHRVVWKPENSGSGVYFYQLKTGEDLKTGKCLFIK